MKHEPQSLHWSHKQITVHSGILKANGVTLNLMANIIDEYLIVESDNAVQYKSCQHFDIIQQNCNEQNQPIIRNYGIPEHGKGEVGHVGGITTLRRAIAAGIFLDEVK